MKRLAWISFCAISFGSLIAPSVLQPSGAAQIPDVTRRVAIQRLRDSVFGRGHVKTNRATGLVDFVRLDRQATGGLISSRVATPSEKSLAFLRAQNDSFGLTDPDSQLRLSKEQRDPSGALHQTFTQVHNGVPVFAGVLKTHFNSLGDLRAVNGVIVPDIELNTIASRTSEQAAVFALAKIQNNSPDALALGVKGTKLYVYRTGLAQGVAGENHLVWEIEISNNADVREFVYVDAHSGKFVDQITGLQPVLNRRIYDGQNIHGYPPPNYPSNPFWIEEQAFPTGVMEADALIATTRDTYDLFKNGFGRDSFDGAGATMDAIFNSGNIPGDGSWNGQLTQFATGLAVDDVIGHEWTHAYTQYTDQLIYQWQPGALNEAYSDIFGETIDLLNGRGLDTPGTARTDNTCVSFRNPTPLLHVNSPAILQGDYPAGPATSFGPPFSTTGVTGNVVLVDDGVGTETPSASSRTDGCQTPFRNAASIRGNVALVDAAGGCQFKTRVKNAQLNGAIAVIVAYGSIFGDVPRIMLGNDPTITIPSALIGYSDGQAFRAPGVRILNVTIRGDAAPTDDSYRWLIGEEFFTPGARDIWNPRCNGAPGKVSDVEYFCTRLDSGGVHFNSGIPNHAYALLVDGGSYNNQTIQPIGFTKAAHIYFRAMSIYQTPTTDFADHAEALDASASDLVGVNLRDLQTGNPSGEVITLSDLEQVHKATLAVELRTPPSQCEGRPLLNPNTPEDTCDGPKMNQVVLFSDDFESDPFTRWTISREALDESIFTPRDWTWAHTLPGSRPGSGFFAPDPIDDCTFASPGQAGVLHLESPVIRLPPAMPQGPHLSFDHWVSTEAFFDGGQLMISVNGGPFKLLPPSAFIFNPYNATLFPLVADNLNPRAGQPAFTGANGKSLDGSWGTSIVDLTGRARPGDRVKFRWDFSTDFCFGTTLGWYVDNVRVYSCRP